MLVAAGVYHSSRHDNIYGARQMPGEVKKHSKADSKDSADKHQHEQYRHELNADLEQLDQEMAAKVQVDNIDFTPS